jgi:hypothetical protein
MYEFQITIHARPADAITGESIELAGVTVQTLQIPRESLGTPFQLSFEQVSEALGKLPRMFFEPDGSFVWVSSHGSPTWQLDGVVYDRGDRLLYVDLKGSCPASEFDVLLTALGWPATPLMFQLVREAVFLDEAEFRRFVNR